MFLRYRKLKRQHKKELRETIQMRSKEDQGSINVVYALSMEDTTIWIAFYESEEHRWSEKLCIFVYFDFNDKNSTKPRMLHAS